MIKSHVSPTTLVKMVNSRVQLTILVKIRAYPTTLVINGQKSYAAHYFNQMYSMVITL